LEQSIREENGLIGVRSEADENLAKRRETLLREKRGRVVTTSCSSSCSGSGISSSVASSISSEDDISIENGRSKRRQRTNAVAATKRQKRETNAAAAVAEELETFSRNYHEEWMKLLAERPRRQDEAGLEEWLGKVVTLSSGKMSSDPPLLRAQVE
jgi:hypothetical protein